MTFQKPPSLQKNIYVVDHLNIWSDYREIKYKKANIDFHSVKHTNKEEDTIAFFELFFTRYINYAKMDINSNFIFVLKKISNYDKILIRILEKYSNIEIRFIIIETKYDQILLDKNKDDFLCQYILCFLMEHNDNCILISNDKYRDLNAYIDKFSSASIRVMKLNKNVIENSVMELNINESIIYKNKKNYKRCTIPKNKIQFIL
jgi:hypothetical protein